MAMLIAPKLFTKAYQQRRTPPAEDEKYRQLYRFHPETVDYLCEEFMQQSEETRGAAVSPKQRMEIALRYLSDPGFQRGVAEDAGCHQSTVSRAVKSTVAQICTGAHRWIKFPMTAAEVQLQKEAWRLHRTFPSCVGAVDCTHVRIDKPAGDFGDEFVNRKNFASINVQATCDASLKFTSIDASWPGSVHDSRIFRNSSVCSVLAEGHHGALLLGDSGYGLTPFLLTPFENPTAEEEKHYNKIHSKSRVAIEQTFGMVKRRFPILRYGVRTELSRVPQIIIACCVLHNIAITRQEPEDFADDNVDDAQMDCADLPPRLSQLQLRIQGQNRRQQIAALLYHER